MLKRWNFLKTGFYEGIKYGRTLSGTPQGGVVSPILANIYLDRLDKSVETVLIPAHTRGKARKYNREWANVKNLSAYYRKVGNHAMATALRKPESTEGRPWGQPLKKPEGAPLNLG